MPFRDAYQQVGRAVEDGSYVPHREFRTTHLGSIHNLGLEVIATKVRRWKRESGMLPTAEVAE